MEERSLVSVIVPVYKVERYLVQCIDSILNQTYTNLEIILVDDRSPDSCPSICDDYSKKDKRITTIHRKTNGGLSEARNTGMAAAHGEYFLFVDSDDWIAENLIETAITKMEQYSVDIVSFSANIVINDVVANKEYVYSDIDTVLSAAKATEIILTDRVTSHAWMRLYKSYCWKNIRFPSGRLYEDIATTHKVFDSAANGICFIPEALYFYRHNNEGITLSWNPVKPYHMFLGYREHYEYAKEYYPQVSDECLLLAITRGLRVINHAFDGTADGKNAGAEAVRMFLDSNRKEVLSIRCDSFKRYMMVRTYYHCYPLYAALAKVVMRLRRVRDSLIF